MLLNYYIPLKHTHMLIALISISFLVFRFACLQRNAQILQKKWLRILPHYNDTLLFVLGITLMFSTGQYPFASYSQWLTEKLGLLICYIGLGFIALRKKPIPPMLRYSAFTLALICFGLMYYLAKTKIGFFG